MPDVVVVLSVFAGGDAHLVIRRPVASTGGGALGFCGGKVDPGEDEVAAVRRETREELGIDVVVGEHLGTWAMPEWGCTVSAWEVMGDTSALAPSPAEVAEVLWLTDAELRGRPDVLRSTLCVLDALASRSGRATT